MTLEELERTNGGGPKRRPDNHLGAAESDSARKFIDRVEDLTLDELELSSGHTRYGFINEIEDQVTADLAEYYSTEYERSWEPRLVKGNNINRKDVL